MIVIPMPPAGVGFTAGGQNLTISAIILVSVVFVQSPLELSSFPRAAAGYDALPVGVERRLDAPHFDRG